MPPVFILAVSMMIFFFSSGESMNDSPVEPMIRIAEVPLSAWNLSRARNASKSTEPSMLNGVIRATNEPVSSLADIAILRMLHFLRRYHGTAASNALGLVRQGRGGSGEYRGGRHALQGADGRSVEDPPVAAAPAGGPRPPLGVLHPRRGIDHRHA